jgi:Tfp pilus assembly protein PilP
MKNKKIAMASALVLSGVLTLNSSVFAATPPASPSSASQSARPSHMEQGFQMHRAGSPKMLQGSFHDGDWGTKLKEFVTAGTITQETADKIQAYLNEQQAAMKVEREKLQSMTPTERKAYFESKKSEKSPKTNLLAVLVEKGILTQAQADTLKEKVQLHQNSGKSESGPFDKKSHGLQNIDWTSQLDKLAAAGTLTKEQVSKVLEYVKQKQENRTAEMEKVKAMTEEERTAYFKNAIHDKTDIWTQLVADKVLTQEQADAVAKAIHLG